MELKMHDKKNEENDLESLELPPLNIRNEFDEYFSNANSIFVYNEQDSNISNNYFTAVTQLLL